MPKALSGWKSLVAGGPWFRGAGAYPLPAYSEFLPPPRLGPTPYGATAPTPFEAGDPWGWHVAEHEESAELRPGLEQIARQVIGTLAKLGRGEKTHRLSRASLENNPYWPPELAERAGRLKHERFVVLHPLALSRTQDDKGRVRWTFFGGSDLGPSYAFWRGFFSAPKRERPAEEGLAFLRNLLASAFGEDLRKLADLRRAGLRILPQGELLAPLPDWTEGPLPSWSESLLWDGKRLPKSMRYLLTFRPFSHLSEAVRRAYLDGKLHLIPFPGSLLFWGVPLYLELRASLPRAVQLPLQHLVDRHVGPEGFRVPQSGWLHEPRPGSGAVNPRHGPLREGYRRTHRHARVHRDADHDAAVSQVEDKVAHVLFDSSEAAGLYGKPMARNAQIWTPDGRLLLDGPSATREELAETARALRDEGGLFGYRFQFPAMRVGIHEVFWHRPLVGFLPQGAELPRLIADAPTGVFTADRDDRRPASQTIELWPRIRERPDYRAAATLCSLPRDANHQVTSRNCRVLLETRDLIGGHRLARSYARRLIRIPAHDTLDAWLSGLPALATDDARGRSFVQMIERAIEPREAPAQPSLTFAQTACRPFEIAYWTAIDAVSTGRFPNRNNADPARDAATLAALPHPGRDLDKLGDFLIKHHEGSMLLPRG